MSEAEISPQYEIIAGENLFGIFGKERTTGETVLINKISSEEKIVLEIAEILNKNKVSVHHTKDVVRDLLIEAVL